MSVIHLFLEILGKAFGEIFCPGLGDDGRKKKWKRWKGADGKELDVGFSCKEKVSKQIHIQQRKNQIEEIHQSSASLNEWRTLTDQAKRNLPTLVVGPEIQDDEDV